MSPTIFKGCEGAHELVIKPLELIDRDAATCLIITRHDTESKYILNGIIRRLNVKQIAYESDESERIIAAKGTTIHIHSELQLHNIRFNNYQHILYNRLIEHDHLDNLKSRFGS